MEVDVLNARLDAAVAGGGSLRTAVSEIDQWVFDDAEFPDPLFDHLLQLLASPLLRDHADALTLVKLFEEQAGLLRPDQQARLVQALHTFVTAVRDDLAAFLALEVLVELAASERAAFDDLINVETRCTPKRLAVLVHGFDWLCKKAQDAQVRDDCLSQLKRLQRHGHAAVSSEAGAAIVRRTRTAR